MARQRARLAAGPLRALAAGLVALVACGSEGTPPPSEQAEALCRTSIEWRDALGDLVEDLSRTGVRVEDAGERKRLLLHFVDDAEDRTEAMVEEVREQLPVGERGARGRVTSAGTDLDEVWDDVRVLVRSFPDDSDPEPFYSRGTQVTNEVELTAAVWKSALSDVAVAVSPELRAALAEEPACTLIPRTADR